LTALSAMPDRRSNSAACSTTADSSADIADLNCAVRAASRSFRDIGYTPFSTSKVRFANSRLTRTYRQQPPQRRFIAIVSGKRIEISNGELAGLPR
jgi:hypothetical protein